MNVHVYLDILGASAKVFQYDGTQCLARTTAANAYISEQLLQRANEPLVLVINSQDRTKS